MFASTLDLRTLGRRERTRLGPPPNGAVCDDGGMRSIQAVVLPYEIGEFADEVRRVFLELGRTFGAQSLAGECAPAIDVFETDDALEIAVDLPGVDPIAVRVLMKGDALLIVGEKTPRRGRGDSSFHLVE